MEHKYEFKTYNGRIKVYIDGYVMFCFNQLDFKGYYAFKDDCNLYCADFYLVSSDSGVKHTIEVSFKTKETWLAVLKLLDENM
jgi:hypothetical protein